MAELDVTTERTRLSAEEAALTVAVQNIYGEIIGVGQLQFIGDSVKAVTFDVDWGRLAVELSPMFSAHVDFGTREVTFT